MSSYHIYRIDGTPTEVILLSYSVIYCIVWRQCLRGGLRSCIHTTYFLYFFLSIFLSVSPCVMLLDNASSYVTLCQGDCK